MNTLQLLSFATIAFVASTLAEDSNLIPNSSFEDIRFDGRPEGWRVGVTPKEAAADVACVSDGKAGTDTHTGVGALQLAFPDGTEVSMAVWAADPDNGGVAVEPGKYKCSFWIKANDMMDAFHTWLQIDGYGPNKVYVKEVTRSGYLRAKDFPGDDWVEVTFPFDILPDDGITHIAPMLFFKTSADGSENPVPSSTRILLDDIEITKN